MKKNGKRNGVQLYKCIACGRQFRDESSRKELDLWKLYLENKQTIKEISQLTNLSESTVKRRLKNQKVEWIQPHISGAGVVHIDATYFGRNAGVILALEANTGRVLYMQHIAHEHVEDYTNAVSYIKSQGYIINGIVIDGFQSLFKELGQYPIQMCQFHMVAIVRRKITQNPQLEAGKELLTLIYRLKNLDKASFIAEFEHWKTKWKEFLREKTINPITQRTTYTHQRLRSAMTSISFYLKWLFTFEEVQGMPRTNNQIEGSFTDLKNNLRNHAGMTEESRKRFINGFFLAYTKSHNKRGDDN